MSQLSKQVTKGKRFLSGFGNDDYMHDLLLGKDSNQSPNIILSENEKHYKMEINVPDYEEEDLSIYATESTLVVKGLKRTGKGKSGARQNDSEGLVFRRTIKLPENINNDLIKAGYRDGVLKIIIPKNEEQKLNSTSIEFK